MSMLTRYAYDALFVTLGSSTIKYKGEVYEPEIALWFKHCIFKKDKDGKYYEISGNPSLAVISYDINAGYKIGYNGTYGIGRNEKVEIVPDSACIWKNRREPVTIPFMDGVKLLISHPELYDNVNNYPAQNTAYYTEEITVPED